MTEIADDATSVSRASRDAGGYVLAYRRTLNHHAFRSHAEALAFTYLTMLAAWKPTTIRYKDRVINLKRGQLAMSVRDLATHLERDRQWAERFINRLKSESMIETSTETGVSVITICNYDTYQCSSGAAETPTETPSETAARQRRDSGETQNKEDKEGKKGKEEKKGDARGTRLTEDFVVPEDWRVWAKTELGLERHRVDMEASKFTDYWVAQSGSKGVKADWKATWRNWVRNAVKYDKPKLKVDTSPRIPGISPPMTEEEKEAFLAQKRAEWAQQDEMFKRMGVL